MFFFFFAFVFRCLFPRNLHSLSPYLGIGCFFALLGRFYDCVNELKPGSIMETSIPVLSLEADTQIQVIDFFPLGDTSSGSNNHSDLLLILSVSEQLTFSIVH